MAFSRFLCGLALLSVLAPGVVDAQSTRDAAAQALIEQNYFDIVSAVHPSHATALPEGFLDRAGLRGEDPADWEYPGTSGGTLKSAGHVYTDEAGNEYLVPDLEVVIELAENVVMGPATSIVRGSAGTPDSFVMNDMLVVFNQDPRFPSTVFGAGEVELPREVLFDELTDGSLVTAIGYMVGEHVFFALEVFTDLSDPAAGPTATLTRLDIRPNRIRYRGVVANADDYELFVILGDEEFDVDLEVDPETGEVGFDDRQRGINTGNFDAITLELRDATGVVGFSETIDFDDFAAAAAEVEGPPSGTTAILEDGTVLTVKMPLEPWGTEGPIWDIDVDNQTLTVVGRQVTFPATIDGADFFIDGTSIFDENGVETPISASTFARLVDLDAITTSVDASAAGVDLGPLRLGATRSIFSTVEARRSLTE